MSEQVKEQGKKRQRQFVRTYDYANGTAAVTLPDGTVLGRINVQDFHPEVASAFVLQKGISHIANAYTGAIKRGKDAAKRIAIAIDELTSGDVSFRDGSGGQEERGNLYDVAEVLVELGFSTVALPDKTKLEFSDADSAYAALKQLWAAPAVGDGPSGRAIYAKVRAHPKVAAKLAESREADEDVLG